MSDDHEWVDLDEVANIVHLASLNGDQPDAPVDSWTPLNLNDLPDQPPVQPNLGKTGLVYPGKRHVFSGPPESAKTLAAYAVLIQTVSSGSLAVLIDFEMGAYDARQRLRELGATDDELSRILFLEPDEPASGERILRIVSYQPVLVVVDAAAGVYQLEGLDDNKRQDVEKIAKLYTTVFRRNGIATIMIDHVVKDAEMRGRFVIGSERKLGGADVHLGFSTIRPVNRGSHGLYKITTHKDRGGYLKRGHLADLHLESDPETNVIAWKFTEATGEDAPFRPTNLMEKASRELEDAGAAASRNDLCRRAGGNRKAMLQAIGALVSEGFVDETDIIQTHRPYRESDPQSNPDETSGTVIFARLEPLVPSGSTVVPEPATGGAGSHRFPLPFREGVVEPPTHPPAEPQIEGWFSENGNYQDTDAAYIDSLEPDDLDTGPGT